MKSLLIGLLFVALVGPRVLGAEPEKPAPEKAPADKPEKVLTPAEAMAKTGETVTVEMLVKAVKSYKDHWNLESDPRTRDAHDLILVIDKDAMAKFKANQIHDFYATYKGKTVRAHGKVTRSHLRWEIKLSGPDDIEIVDGKDAPPEK